jgi:hypothetical protein
MKKRLFTVALAFMAMTFGASLAYAAPSSTNIVGYWEMTMNIADRDGFSSSGPEYFVIYDQDEDLFTGFGCPEDELFPERTEFYGVLEGRNIHFTSNDAIGFGTVNKAGTEMNIINQVQGYNEICVPSVDPLPGECDGSKNISALQRIVATKLNDHEKKGCPE